jgi:hypothetical protein
MAEKLIVDNRRARHEYHLGDRFEAGLVLTGTEVKSLRGGEATLKQAYAEVRDGEAWLVGLHVPEYTEGNRANHDPDRPRKLLLHRREIERLASSVAEKASRSSRRGSISATAASRSSSRSRAARSCATSAATSRPATHAARSSAS